MRTLAAILLFALAIVPSVVSANHSASVKEIQVGIGQTKKAGKVKVKFAEVIEDSRCPEGTQCIWAGNAKVKLVVNVNGGRAETIELNTGSGNTAAIVNGYSIELVSLTPARKAGIPTGPRSYRARLQINLAGKEKSK